MCYKVIYDHSIAEVGIIVKPRGTSDEVDITLHYCEA